MPTGTSWFEIDQADMLAAKDAALRQNHDDLGRMKCRVLTTSSHPHVAGVSWFEVDRADVLAAKGRALRHAGAQTEADGASACPCAFPPVSLPRACERNLSLHCRRTLHAATFTCS